jgi:hypothetical protein
LLYFRAVPPWCELASDRLAAATVVRLWSPTELRHPGRNTT